MSEPERKGQPDKFKELARELECDEDEPRWEERLKKIVEKETDKD